MTFCFFNCKSVLYCLFITSMSFSTLIFSNNSYYYTFFSSSSILFPLLFLKFWSLVFSVSKSFILFFYFSIVFSQLLNFYCVNTNSYLKTSSLFSASANYSHNIALFESFSFKSSIWFSYFCLIVIILT